LSQITGLARRGFLAAFVALLCVAAAPAGRPQSGLRVEPLTIITMRGPVAFRVEIADTERTREIGMMWRTSVPSNTGMLFDFRTPRPVAFWMRNTLVPLDMIFIGQDGRIVSIASNARPRDETPIPGGTSIRAVLELRGGRAAEIGALPGDRVVHRIFPRG
jgi:uncharacterized membrane protein (UPF0127 family)